MQSGAKGKLLINFDILNEYNNNIADIKSQQSKLHDVRDKTTNAPVPDMAALEEALPPSGGSFPPGVKMLHYWIKED